MVRAQGSGRPFGREPKKWVTSHVGWARSNILYNTLKEPPTPGSPLEYVILQVFYLRQAAEFQKYRLVAQSSLSPETSESSKDALKDLLSSMFPYRESEERDRSAQALRIFERQIAAGPMRITPIEEKRNK